MTAPRPSDWFSADDLAALDLPCLPGTVQGVNAYADEQSWRTISGGVRQKPGRGGGYEYHMSVLPMEAQRALAYHANLIGSSEGERRVAAVKTAHQLWMRGSLSKSMAVHQAARLADVSAATVWRWLSMVAGVPEDGYLEALTPTAPVETVPSNPVETRIEALPDDVTQLSDTQRETMVARVALLDRLETLPLPLAEMAEADEALHALAVRANGHADRLPSVSTIKRWRKFRREGGEIALAPVFKPRLSEPAWLAPFWRFYGLPSKPSVPHARKKLLEEHPEMKLPPVRTMQRYVASMGLIAKNKGRMGARELRKYRPYRARTFLELEPLDVVSADGHTFDAEVLHPNTGRPFRPEIGTVADYATRRIVGWSVDLAENKMMVAAAMRKVCETGIPAIFYVDNGPGYKNDILDNEATGMLTRCGITKEHSLPYGAQAKGFIEKINHTVWVRASKMMPGYIGKDMDREAGQKIHKVSRAVIKGTSDARQPLAEWAVFVAYAEQCVAEYNATPHSSLPKITDPETGRKRHQSPDERWAMWVDKGWEPVTASQDVLDDLWRPYETRTAMRGLVSIGGGKYFSRELAQDGVNGEVVQVGQDIHDASRVWVRHMDGRFICVAELDANASSVFPKTRIEASKDVRADAQIKRIQRKEEELLANTRTGLAPLEIVAEAMPDVSPQVAARMARIAGTAVPDPTVVQIPPDPASRLRLWRTLQERVDGGEVLNGIEEGFHRNFSKSADYRAALRMESFGQEKGPSKGAS